MNNLKSSSSSSSSSSNEFSYLYDVFISFRGPDTRRRFVGYLYPKLCEIQQAKIFMDDRTIEPGDLIDNTLIKAIQESRIGLVIFSPNYASSRYCLEELAMIVERSIDQKCMLFLPVFYDIEPTILRHQKGNYEEALTNHETRFGKQKIHEWRIALEKAAGVSGFTSNKYRYDTDLISDIAHSITKKISKFREGEKNQRTYNMEDENIARHNGQLKLLKTLKPNDLELPRNEEDPNAIEKAPEGTPAFGGLLVIIIHEAEHVEGKNHTNPCARLIFKGEERRTKHVKKNRDPIWGEEFQFMLEEPPSNDRLYVEVQSASSKLGLLHPKETLGYVNINLSDVVSHKRIKEKYHLVDSRSGRIQIELQWRTP